MDINNNKITQYLEQNGSQFRNGYWTAPFPPFEKKHGVFSIFQATNGNFICKYLPTGESFGLNKLIDRIGVVVDEGYTLKETNFNTTTTEIIADYDLSFPNYLEYLSNRKLDRAVCSRYLRQVQYRTEKGRFFGIGFKNDKGGYEITVPSASVFKTCTSKQYSLIRGSDNKQVLVFEGVYDFLAYLTDRGIESDTLPCDVVVLNSSSTASDFTSWNKYDVIHYLGDNDREGLRVLKMIKECNNNVIDHRSRYKDFKDYNDYLIYKKGIE